ncbi:hypothetical protein ACFW88_27425 [Streptomyces anandii]|uniref:Holin n=1 Tax=Streptomyces anandii TaxID=285454 RepID=A0ABW6HC78_9ACTN
MPSQLRTSKDPRRRKEATSADKRAVGPAEATGGGRHVWRLEVPAIKLPKIASVTAVGSGGGLTAAIATGHVRLEVVWPAVALAVAGMAYDIAVRALDRTRRN